MGDLKIYKDFAESQFSENDFVALLLPLLCKNGITKIQEQELAKYLYPYYKNPKYAELFKDIIKSRDALIDKVDIYQGLYAQKFWSGCVGWDSMKGSLLHLVYPPEKDLSYYEGKLTEDGKERMQQLVQELAIRYKVMDMSKNNIYIYGQDPNDKYNIICGRKAHDFLEFQILTDGNVEDINIKTIETDEIFVESPIEPDVFIKLNHYISTDVILTDATFAIKQGLKNGKIQYSDIMTEVVDPEVLQKISNAANCLYHNNIKTYTDEAPYVRKISLK